MNAFYVTVSIPLLLVLAGFNHAHGLTTFGKSNSQSTQNTPQQPPVQSKSCVTQANCTLIKGTTCLKGFCFCGDNTHPVNGICKAQFKGPRHICNTDDECVDGADCLPPKDKNNKTSSALNVDKICTCAEGLYEAPGGMCGEPRQLSLPTSFTIKLHQGEIGRGLPASQSSHPLKKHLQPPTGRRRGQALSTKWAEK